MYDNIGNRQSFTLDTAAPVYYCVNPLNQYDHTAADAACNNPLLWYDYDADGNMLAESAPPYEYAYTWDGENRLVEVYAMNGQSGNCADDRLLRFAYDYMGRRVQKQVYHYIWNEQTQSCEPEPELVEDWRFVYDGWNVVLVLDGRDGEDPGTEPDNVTTRKYTRGLDLSGQRAAGFSPAGIHTAGGIGGLLAVEETAGTHQGSHWFFYDGNGNVSQAIYATSQFVATHYEYDPYGNAIVADGTYAATNPFRFSTKWFDAETGLHYYGYRYYDGDRWLNRDPIEEEGGLNLYTFVGNQGISQWDSLGDIGHMLPPPPRPRPPRPTHTYICGCVCLESCFFGLIPVKEVWRARVPYQTRYNCPKTHSVVCSDSCSLACPRRGPVHSATAFMWTFVTAMDAFCVQGAP